MRIDKWVCVVGILFTAVNLTAFSQSSLSPREMLRYGLTFADDDESSQRVEAEALANPTLLEEIVFLRLGETGNLNNRVARQNAFTYLKICSQRGLISQAHFFEIGFNLLKNLSDYAFPGDLADETARYQNQILNYGYNPKSKKATGTVFDNLQALLVYLDGMFKAGQISNQGVLQSLKVKISGALAILEKEKEKGKTPATNKIEAAISEANAQRGKNLTEIGFLVFSAFCQNLISQIQETIF